VKTVKTILSVLLTAALLVSLLPAALPASAVGAPPDGEPVLKSLDHRDAHRISSDPIAPGDEIILYVASSYDNDTIKGNPVTINLSTNLVPVFDPAVYKNVVPSFEPSTEQAEVDGAPVALTVTYNHLNDPEGTPKGATTYSISVRTADEVSPVFSGTIAAEVTGPGTLIFSNLDFASKYIKNDAANITAISISGSNPTFGALRKSGGDYVFGTPVSLTSLSQLTFSAKTTGDVTYDVKAYAGTATDPEDAIGNVVLTIHAYSVPKINPISSTVSKGTIMYFNEGYFTGGANMYSMPLVSVEITPTNTTFGTWYLGKTTFSAATNITVDQLPNLTFSANKAGTATFNWRLSNKAGFSAVGTGTIVITSPALKLNAFDSAQNALLKGNTWPISLGHFVYEPLSASMSYIKITAVPPAGDGYLYLENALPKDDVNGYPAIPAKKALTTNAIIPAAYIGDLRLATKLTSKADQAVFKWTATPDVKISTAVWAEPATYTVSFVNAGTLLYDVDMNAPYSFAPNTYDSDPTSRISSRFRERTGGLALSYVTFVLPDKKIGSLYLNYDPTTKKGTAVTASSKYYLNKNPNLAAITFVPAQDYTGETAISYTAYAESGFYLTGTLKFDVHNSSGGTLNLLTDKNQPLQLDAAAFSASYKAATGKTLSHVVFYIPTSFSSYGRLYYDYQSYGGSETAVTSGNAYYTLSAPFLSLVTFVPAKDYTGTFSLGFRGYTSDGAYEGKVNITVSDSPGGIVTYSLAQNKTVTLSGDDFSNEFIHVTGSVLSYVTFTPPQASSGTLYYQYDAETQKGTKVAASAKYYDGKTPDISDLTFVPAKDFIGQVVISYTAVTSSGATYLGKLKLNVTDSTLAISVISEDGKPIDMPEASIANAFTSLSGETLSYVTFELPSPTYGKLYYKYVSTIDYDTAVSAGTSYYYLRAPYLSNVSFVPASDYTGSFTLKYTGYTDDGTSYPGKIRITVANRLTGTVTYKTNTVTPVSFNSWDFSSAFPGNLYRVVFSLPPASQGKLYYSYASSGSYQYEVTSATSFYAASSPYLSYVTFVPNNGFTGIVVIHYIAYSTTGTSSYGTVLIMVESSEIETITYATSQSYPVQFAGEDFNSAFLSKTGSSLYYVKFDTPPASVGKLYLGYDAPNSYTAAVTPSGKYYRSFSPLLSNISFVPASNFTGPAVISYTAYTITGTAYTGNVIINVGNDTPFEDLDSYPWASDAISYLYRNGVVTGSGYNEYNPSGIMSRGDFVLMIARAFGLSGGYDNFSDVPEGSYYYDAIAAAKAFGIVTGNNGKFSPAVAISRQDAMVIIRRALDAVGTPIASGKAADLSGYYDASEVSGYATEAVASLIKAGIVTGNGGMLRPKAMINRAEMAVILYRVLTM
jgi:hypothetical protein